MGKVAITIGVAVVAMLLGGGCGGDDSGGSRTLKWYVFAEPSGGAFKEAADTCNTQAQGRYRIDYRGAAARRPTSSGCRWCGGSPRRTAGWTCSASTSRAVQEFA